MPDPSWLLCQPLLSVHTTCLCRDCASVYQHVLVAAIPWPVHAVHCLAGNPKGAVVHPQAGQPIENTSMHMHMHPLHVHELALSSMAR